jgi:hypothetical protein
MHQWDWAIERDRRGGKILKDVGVAPAAWICECWVAAHGCKMSLTSFSSAARVFSAGTRCRAQWRIDVDVEYIQIY